MDVAASRKDTDDIVGCGGVKLFADSKEFISIKEEEEVTNTNKRKRPDLLAHRKVKDKSQFFSNLKLWKITGEEEEEAEGDDGGKVGYNRTVVFV